MRASKCRSVVRIPDWLPVKLIASSPRGLDGDGEEGHGHALAGRDQHVELAARWIGRSAPELRGRAGELEEPVGRLSHRAHHDDDLVPRASRLDDAEGRALRLVGTDADITRRKEAETELRHRAEFDLLTGLPNRALFNDRIAHAMERAERYGTTLALLFVDIDHFKVVNDTHGHEAGDELLKIAAARLRGVVRTSDMVARLAGDEFTVILEGLGSIADAQAVAAKLVEALRAPMRIAGAPLVVSTSVGLAMFEPGERDPATLLRRADEALYEAKRRGRDRYAMRLVSAA